MSYIIELLRVFLGKKVDPKDFPECLDCGVCCATFRIMFNKKENPQMSKHEQRIHFISKDTYIMKGSERFGKGKCNALVGTINKDAYCSIYEDRPNVCRAYQRVLPNGKINPRCIQARNTYLKRLKKESKNKP